MSWADSSSSAGAPSPAAASSASGAASSPGGPAALNVLPTCSWPPICSDNGTRSPEWHAHACKWAQCRWNEARMSCHAHSWCLQCQHVPAYSAS